MLKRLLLGALVLGWVVPCHAAQVCSWMKETVKDGDELQLELWMQADAHVEFLLQVGGKGIVVPGNTGNAPTTATYMLDAGKPEMVWSYGQTLYPPGKIDVILEMHEWPKDIFSKAPTPLLASFKFQRDVVGDKLVASPALAKKQCATVKGKP